jgi:hypothetical protein
MKLVKPYIDRPFIPQEVDKLVQEKRRNFGEQDTMKQASYVGPVNKEQNTNPSIYTTVVQSHPTTVVHPVPQPNSYAVHQQTAGAFGTDSSDIKSEIQQMSPGAYSIPVHIQGGAATDPTLSGYENPTFIHKGEKVLKNAPTPPSTNPIGHIQESSQEDIKKLVSSFENNKDKQERTQACKYFFIFLYSPPRDTFLYKQIPFPHPLRLIFTFKFFLITFLIFFLVMQGKARLDEEAKKLAAEVEADLKELLLAKEVSIRINNLMASYEVKMRKDQLSKLKLSDEITIKNLLRDKLQREMQGFRTSPQEYKELDIVNPADLTNIITGIKTKLGQ